jgi:SAM-dependent methyltransferase
VAGLDLDAARVRLYPESEFGGYSRWDGTVAFYTRVRATVDASFRVLDFGCGIGAHLTALPAPVRAIQQLKGRVREVVGVDVSAAGAFNPWVDRFVLLENGAVPLDTGYFDACVCDWALEHVLDVEQLFRELARLLRPGGYLFIRTPNLLHYSSIAARLLPFSTHAAVRRWLGQFHTTDDVFPVHYRCNTRGRLRRTYERHGFESVVIVHRGESHLTGVGRLAGRFGDELERLLPPGFSHELHAFGRRRGNGSGAHTGVPTPSVGG